MEVQAETEFIEVKSPIDRFKEEWGKLPGKSAFLRQHKFILKNSDLVQYAELARTAGWKQPLLFALQGLLLAAFLLSGLSWLMTRDEGKQADEIAQVQADLESQIKTQQGLIDASEFEMERVKSSRKSSGFKVATSTNLSKEEALQQLNVLIDDAHKQQDEYKLRAEIKMQDLRAAGDGLALIASGTAVIFSLALIFAAPLFRLLTHRHYGRYRLAADADSYYLYYVPSRGLWQNLALVIVMNVFLSGSAYGLGGLIEAVGPIGQILFWLALYAVLLHWLFLVSKDLNKAMQLPKLRDYKDLENRVLLDLHSSFAITFLALESALGLLAYGVYLLEKAS
jgi:hypothetical protein